MRAAVFQGVGHGLAIVDVPIPVPGPGQVRLRVGACGICGSDLDQARHGSPQMPTGCYTPGHQYAGEVVEVGPETERFQIGDRIVAPPIQGCGSCGECLMGEPMWCTGDRPARRVGAYAEFVLN